MSRAYVSVIPEPIFPGSAFRVIWGLCPPNGNIGTPTIACTVSLTINGRIVFPLPDSDDANLPGGSIATAVSGERSAGAVLINSTRIEQAGMRLSDFYHEGTHGPVIARFRQVAHLPGITDTSAASTEYVIATGFATPSIQFTLPAEHPSSSPYSGDVRAAVWKEPYTCAICIQNIAPTQVHITATLREVSADSPGAILNSIDIRSLTIASGESQTIIFSPITKEWQWFVDGGFAILPDKFHVGFTYDIALSGTDEFGNSADSINSPVMTVLLSVPEEKQNLGIAAVSMRYTAIAARIVAIATAEVPIAGIIAEAFADASEIAADILSAEATDPPLPDPNYKTPTPYSLPPQSTTLSQLPIKAASLWMKAALEFAHWRNQLYLIESKILGAWQAQDATTESDLVKEYAYGLRQLGNLYTVMTTNLDDAVKELQQLGWTRKHFESGLDKLHAQSVSGMWSEELVKSGTDLGRLTTGAAKWEDQNYDLRKALRTITLALGRSSKILTEISVRRYAEMRPNYFSPTG